MQSDEILREVERKVGAEFSISADETHGCVCMVVKNDTHGRVDISRAKESESGVAKKAGGHLVFELV